MAKIRKGDQVLVIAGRDKGKEGRVIRVIPKVDKIVVDAISRVKKHNKVSKGDRGATQGGIETFEAPIHISNVMLIDSTAQRKQNKYTRVGFRYEDGRKVRVSKQTGKELL
jgi:large subunit ribosomal protein L24